MRLEQNAFYTAPEQIDQTIRDSFGVMKSNRMNHQYETE
jgi:hypothetical protein